MSADETVPSLSSEDTTPAERPISKSTQRRAAPSRPVAASSPRETPGPAAPPLPGEPVARAYARWRVTEDQEVPRGASSFLLRREQVLSEQQFDVPALLAQGVKLERLPD